MESSGDTLPASESEEERRPAPVRRRRTAREPEEEPEEVEEASEEEVVAVKKKPAAKASASKSKAKGSKKKDVKKSGTKGDKKKETKKKDSKKKDEKKEKKKGWSFFGKKDDEPKAAKKKVDKRGPIFFRSAEHDDTNFKEIKLEKLADAAALRKALDKAFPEYAGQITGLADIHGASWSLDKFWTKKGRPKKGEPKVNYHIVCSKLKVCRHCKCPFSPKDQKGKKKNCPTRGDKPHETDEAYKKREAADELEQKKRASKIRKKYTGCSTCRKATLDKHKGLAVTGTFGPAINYKCEKCGCYWIDNSHMPQATRAERKRLSGPYPPDEVSIDDVSTGELDPPGEATESEPEEEEGGRRREASAGDEEDEEEGGRARRREASDADEEEVEERGRRRAAPAAEQSWEYAYEYEDV